MLSESACVVSDSSSISFPVPQSRDVAEGVTTMSRTIALVWSIRAATRPWLPRRGRPIESVAQAQQKLEWYGTRAGVTWEPGVTLREYADALARQLAENESLRELVELVEQAQYGGRPLAAHELRSLQAAGEQVWAQLRRLPRRKLDITSVSARSW